MGFTDADAYDRFMGKYSVRLAAQFADFAGVVAGQRAIDVGCGPGALTGELVVRLGANSVSAVDPSEPFCAAVAERYPGVDVRRATAEHLPFPGARFDRTLAQLVVHFMTDPVRAIGEMGRVTRSSGVVAACVWDYAGDRGPLGPFWEVARALDPGIDDESYLPGVRQGHLGELFASAGLERIEETTLRVTVQHDEFEEWWEPFTLGVGPAGGHLTSLDAGRQEELRQAAKARLPDAPFVITGHAWAAKATAG